MCKRQNDAERENVAASVIEKTMSKMKSMIDTSIVVGNPIINREDFALIPLSKVTVGFVSGAGEYGNKNKNEEPFAGGSGGGYSVSPVGFAMIESNNIKIIKVEQNELIEKLISKIPNFLDVIKEKIKKDNKNEDN